MTDKAKMKVYLDRIEDEVATVVLYEDDKVKFNLPVRYLPAEAKEGDYFQLTFKKDKQSRAAEKKKADDLLNELLAQNQGSKSQG